MNTYLFFKLKYQKCKKILIKKQHAKTSYKLTVQLFSSRDVAIFTETSVLPSFS